MAKEQWQGPSTVGEKVGVRSIPAELHSVALVVAAAEMTGPLSSLSQSHPFPSSSSQQPKTDEADGNPFPSLRLHLGSRAWPSTRRLDRCRPISAAEETTRGSNRRARCLSDNKTFPYIHQLCESWRIEIDCKTDRWGVPTFPSKFFPSASETLIEYYTLRLHKVPS